MSPRRFPGLIALGKRLQSQFRTITVLVAYSHHGLLSGARYCLRSGALTQIPFRPPQRHHDRAAMPGLDLVAEKRHPLSMDVVLLREVHQALHTPWFHPRKQPSDFFSNIKGCKCHALDPFVEEWWDTQPRFGVRDQR